MSTDDAEQQHRDEIMSISVFFAIGILLLVAVCVIWSKHHPRTAIPPVVPHRDPQRHHNLPVTLHAGLTKVEIALIPTFAYKSPTTAVNSLGSPAVLQNCVVCLSPVVEGEMVRQLLACNHLFHVECVDMWLFSNPTCPLCRTDAKAPAAEPSPSPELIQNSPSLAV
ncbi:E3 ubiquitin-protein ligase ATL41-like [Curcuma longa]|uniref:E3 ubiquitin-protein ligase ATL41-like n=1 Tax=Curcuma longa TaxID=136217 RepID=UPI003D9DB3CF